MSGTGKIQTIDLTQTLPPALTYDEHSVAFAKALAVGLQENASLAKEAGIYYRIEELPEKILDILATDLHVDWYDSEAELDEKRSVIASSIFVHRHMGTPAAVQRVLEDNFDGGTVEEWFTYEGEPYHFKVTTESIALVYENFDRFLSIISKAKRASAVLDNVEIMQNSVLTVGVGLASKTRFEYTITMGEFSADGIDWLTDENGKILLDENGNILTE